MRLILIAVFPWKSHSVARDAYFQFTSHISGWCIPVSLKVTILTSKSSEDIEGGERGVADNF